MDISMFLAQAFGLYLAIAGIALLAQPKAMNDIIDLFSDSRAAVMVGGLVALVIGIPLVLVHSIWGGPFWQVLVSLLAWATFLKGAMRTLMPGVVMNWANAMKGYMGAMKVMTIIMLVAGLYLCYVGFGFGM